MRGHYSGSVDPWRGITATSMIIAAAVIATVFGIMAALILNQDK